MIDMNAESGEPDSFNPNNDEVETTEFEGGIIERAVRRASDRRDIVVWEGEPVQPAPGLIEALTPGSIRGETLSSLRTELMMRAGTHRGAAMFAIVSPKPGEGRSQLCAELGLAFAQLGGRTLLVDANLREPKLHQLFRGGRSEAGLSDILLGSSMGMPLRRVTGPEHLALLTAGQLPSNPVELLSGAPFERLVGEWSRTYDHVLFDTPPAGVYSDAILVANAVGNVVLIARQNETSFDDVKELRRRLNATRATIVGAVLNTF